MRQFTFLKSCNGSPKLKVVSQIIKSKGSFCHLVTPSFLYEASYLWTMMAVGAPPITHPCLRQCDEGKGKRQECIPLMFRAQPRISICYFHFLTISQNSVSRSHLAACCFRKAGSSVTDKSIYRFLLLKGERIGIRGKVLEPSLTKCFQREF